MKNLSIKQACEVLSFKHVKIRALIRNGEEVKKGIRLRVSDQDYLLAINVGSLRMPRWIIEEDEIIAFLKRKAKGNRGF
jgi:hypothetical protein